MTLVLFSTSLSSRDQTDSFFWMHVAFRLKQLINELTLIILSDPPVFRINGGNLEVQGKNFCLKRKDKEHEFTSCDGNEAINNGNIHFC